ncbi:hypothetical protein AC249_AIPGENE24185 [Exaiptasia diaphana]|nr:hypothetical protein AC249_AIPGENE24185 [Exaiptasia diaphana]
MLAARYWKVHWPAVVLNNGIFKETRLRVLREWIFDRLFSFSLSIGNFYNRWVWLALRIFKPIRHDDSLGMFSPRATIKCWTTRRRNDRAVNNGCYIANVKSLQERLEIVNRLQQMVNVLWKNLGETTRIESMHL